jgi:hypothetical protein
LSAKNHPPRTTNHGQFSITILKSMPLGCQKLSSSNLTNVNSVDP